MIDDDDTADFFDYEQDSDRDTAAVQVLEPPSQEQIWMSRTHTVTDPSGSVTATCDRDRRITALGISESARAHGDYELQSKLVTVMQLAWEKSGAGLRRELAERNPGASTSLLDGFAMSENEYSDLERRTFTPRRDAE